jgi:2-dehydropantoate 2-reductase
MRILVFGAGGVGGYFGGRLAQANLDVSFIARGKHLQALHEHGLRVQSISGDFTVKPIQVTEFPSMIGKVDVVILGVKSWQVKEAAIALRPVIGSNTFVIPLQNGVESPSQLSEILGSKHVVGGMCRIISHIGEPGRIYHVGMNPFISFGELNKKPSDRIYRLYSLFSQTKGLTAEIATDILASMWEKFVLIAPWSGIGAITRSPVGVFRSIPETRKMLIESIVEVVKVAKANKISLSEDIVMKTLSIIDNLPQNSTASMQRDIIEGKPSELMEQNGAVVRLGLQMGVNTPVNTFIYNCLIPQESQARGRVY